MEPSREHPVAGKLPRSERGAEGFLSRQVHARKGVDGVCAQATAMVWYVLSRLQSWSVGGAADSASGKRR